MGVGASPRLASLSFLLFRLPAFSSPPTREPVHRLALIDNPHLTSSPQSFSFQMRLTFTLTSCANNCVSRLLPVGVRPNWKLLQHYLS